MYVCVCTSSAFRILRSERLEVYEAIRRGYKEKLLSGEALSDQLAERLLLMDKILHDHDPKDSKLWELRYIPYYG